MQVALENAPGVSSVHLDLVTRKAVVQVKKGEVTENELVEAVAGAKGMMSYSATVVATQ